MNSPFIHGLGYVWLLLLGLALVASAYSAYQSAMTVEEFPFGCDSFGYLQMAKEIRAAAARRELPQFTIESSQTRLLIDFMQSQGVPLSRWDEMVAPHAHHFFPRADHVAVQYPPGTGLLLALFPEGRAVHGLDRLAIAVFLAVGATVLIAAALRQSWIAAGSAILPLVLGLEILGWAQNPSYSINALLAPLLVSIVCLFTALRLSAGAARPRAAWIVSFLGGLFFALAILVRLPTLLLLPGFLVLLLPASGRVRRFGTAIAFASAVLLFGALPILVHQHRVAGAWYLSTYSRSDAAPPSLAALRENVPLYFGLGPYGQWNRFLPYALLGFAGLAILRRGAAGARPGPGWGRLAWSTLALWGIPTAYFLSHRVATHYYQLPAIFGAAAFLGLGAFTIDCSVAKAESGGPGARGGAGTECGARSGARSGRAARKEQLLRLILLAFALSPGFAAMGHAWKFRPRTLHVAEAPVRILRLPAPLMDERAWIFADSLTGTLRYYADRAAYKIAFADSATRALAYRFAWERGEPQYLVCDSRAMGPVQDEIERMGGTLEGKGEIAPRCPYYLIRWPDAGPAGVPLPPSLSDEDEQ